MAVPVTSWDHREVTTTVLIVDDHEEFRRSARLLLEAQGFLVVGEAADGAEALRAARDLQPDVILLDVVLPDADGFALAEQMTTLAAPPTVVLTSSRRRGDFGPRLEQSSARGFVHKGDLSAAVLAHITAG